MVDCPREGALVKWVGEDPPPEFGMVGSDGGVLVIFWSVTGLTYYGSDWRVLTDMVERGTLEVLADVE